MQIWFGDAKNSTEYSSVEGFNLENPLTISRAMFFIGSNNAGKSRFLRLIIEEINDKTLKRTINIPYYDDLNQLIDFTKFTDNTPPLFEKLTSLEQQNIYFSVFKKTIQEVGLYNSGRKRSMGGSISREEKMSREITFDNIDRFNLILKKLEKSSVSTLEFECLYFPAVRSLKKFENQTLIQMMDYGDLDNNRFFLKNNKNTQQNYTKSDPIDKDKLILDANRQPLFSRFYNDYNLFAHQIVTGEDFYEFLLDSLLGAEQKRKHFSKYEQLLSEYFFENKSISIIPRRDKNEIFIKIEGEQERPISSLGDGLQQLIILTYKPFLITEPMYIFIEEPELHLHARYQKQLINFLLNQTEHHYFFTTHSNTFLDLNTEYGKNVSLYSISKKEDKESDAGKTTKVVQKCEKNILNELGITPSSVFLSNCTIWVEGITDRLYINAYMKKYLEELKTSGDSNYKKCARFIDGYHYSFIEYQGSNLSHWSFDNPENIDSESNRGLKAMVVSAKALLISDKDADGKPHLEKIKKEMSDYVIVLQGKEIENTLPKSVLRYLFFKNLPATGKKGGRNKLDESGIERFNFDMSDDYLKDGKNGIGYYFDKIVDSNFPKLLKEERYTFQGSGQGTIKEKKQFCDDAVKFMNNENWELTTQARQLCKKIFEHISKENL